MLAIKNETLKNDIKHKPRIMRLLSSKSAFFNFLKSNFGFTIVPFVFLKTIKAIVAFNKPKIGIVIIFIALNKDRISIFKITSAKKAKGMMSKLPPTHAIK